ncbi:hypothetical protein [Nesterenkonia sandarakina]|uniref:Uncharacterized protein n=1 Tax=Nesterenkonia sandarakina TaxID=272918 RepID=A0A2T0YB21_9MICC|nr:hypothetical protein [Nesterenkonia sandarakina]PRZ11829.1 hypothetical protein BCL67_12913 [Nesterenkonia sandarakina]
MSDMKSKLANRRAQQQASEPKPTFISAQGSAEQTKRTSYDLPVSVHRRLKLAAVEQDRTQVSILIEALEAWHAQQP